MTRERQGALGFKIRMWLRKEKRMLPCAAIGRVRYYDYPECGFYDIDDDELYGYPDARPDPIYSETTVPLLVDCKGWTNEDRGALAEADVMWWTGLYDKNGREIYEGDIVKVWRCDQQGNAYGQVGVVEFSDGAFCVRLGDGPHYFCHHADEVREYEVVGNIYENPELDDNKS